MKFLSYLLSGLFITLASVCTEEDDFERCDCAVQYFEEDPQEPGSFILDREVREESLCGDSGDTLYLSPTSKQYTYDCR